MYELKLIKLNTITINRNLPTKPAYSVLFTDDVKSILKKECKKKGEKHKVITYDLIHGQTLIFLIIVKTKSLKLNVKTTTFLSLTLI